MTLQEIKLAAQALGNLRQLETFHKITTDVIYWTDLSSIFNQLEENKLEILLNSVKSIISNQLQFWVEEAK
jgi:hypothetical protein